MDKVYRDPATAFRIRIGALGSNEPGRLLFEKEFFDPLPASGVAVLPTAIASDEALGAPTLTTSYLVTASGIPSAEAFGDHTVSLAGGGGQTLSPAGIASGGAFGTPTLLATYQLTATGIASAEAVGAPQVRAAITLSVVSIATGESVSSPAVTSAYVVTATGIASLEGFGPVQVKTSYTLLPSAIASLEALPAPSVLSVYRVQPSSIDSTAAVGEPTIGGVLDLGVPYIVIEGSVNASLVMALETMVARQVLATVIKELEAEVSVRPQ